MVQFDPFPRQRRYKKTYPAQPLSERIEKWTRRVHENSSHLPRPLRTEIRLKYATALGWNDSWVEIDQDGNLFKNAVPVVIEH